MATKKKQTKRHLKKVSKDCWDLDRSFLIWINEHLRIYLKDAGKVIDMDTYKTIRGELTLRQAVTRMIELSNQLLKEIDNIEAMLQGSFAANKNEFFDLLRDSFFQLWW